MFRFIKRKTVVPADDSVDGVLRVAEFEPETQFSDAPAYFGAESSRASDEEVDDYGLPHVESNDHLSSTDDPSGVTGDDAFVEETPKRKPFGFARPQLPSLRLPKIAAFKAPLFTQKEKPVVEGAGSAERAPQQPRRSQLRGKSLPLGVEISEGGIGIVHAMLVNGEFHTDYATWTKFSGALDEVNRASVVETLSSMLRDMGVKERRCILGVSGVDVTSKKLDVPPKVSRKEVMGNAELIAGKSVKYPAPERAISIDTFGKDQLLLSVTRKTIVDYTAELARAAGLKPIAVDASWCAWQRAVPDASAVLDLRGPRPILTILSQMVDGKWELGATYSLSEEYTDEQIGTKLATAFLEARRDKGFNVGSIAVAADAQRYEQISRELLAIGGVRVAPVTIAGRPDANFALAWGFAQWSLPDHGIPLAIRTNMLRDRADVVNLFGLRIPEAAIGQGFLATGAIAAVVIGVLLVQGYRYKLLTDEQAAVVQADSILSARVNRAHQLAVGVSALKAMIDQIAQVRDSGNVQAVAVAQLGSQLRANDSTWITQLAFDPRVGWDIQGGSRSLKDLGTAAVSINKTSTFMLLTTAHDAKGVTYHAQVPLVKPSAAAGAPVPVSATPAPSASPATTASTTNGVNPQ